MASVLLAHGRFGRPYGPYALMYTEKKLGYVGNN